MDVRSAEADPGASRMGLWVFVTSLAVLFLAGVVLFVLARTGVGGHLVRDVGSGSRVELPVWIWASTFFVFCSSVALHQGLQWTRLGRPLQARRALWASTGLGWTFAAFQVPGLWILADRYAAVEGIRPVAVFLVAALSGLHLLHAAGGLAVMTRLAARSRTILPDAAHAGSWSLLAIYWHFLAGLWLVLFSVFVFLR